MTRTTGLRLSRPKASRREISEFLADLALLVQADIRIRSALTILALRPERPALRDLAEALSRDVAGGEPLETAFSTRLGPSYDFVGALIASGQAAGDLGGGLQRAADLLKSKLELQGELLSAVSYPAFILLSTLVSIVIILEFLIPALTPMLLDTGTKPGLTLTVLIWASDGLRANGPALLAVFIAALLFGVFANRVRPLSSALERLAMAGPAGPLLGALTYSSFAVTLGSMLAAGAPMAVALRLAVRSVPSPLSRARLETLSRQVMQGQRLSAGLALIGRMPPTIVRLTELGEVSGALGPMLLRSGKLEEARALGRIKMAGKIAGPVLIVILGGLIGLLMSAILSGVTQIGEGAVQ